MDLSKIYTLASSLISYVFFSASYTHVFVTYSFCNIDDTTWGNRGPEALDGRKHNHDAKCEFVGRWLAWNVALSAVSVKINDYYL